MDKAGNIGIRPIGIGETLRRIVGKSVLAILKSDIQVAGGCLQTSTGIRSGIEASIHAAREAWNLPTTECLLQVDAQNAFNRLNRKVALHNIKEICPPLSTYLHNHYQTAASLFVTDASSQEVFYSEEGSTQGDPSAMPFYSLGTRPLVDILADSCSKPSCMQNWYADDSSAVGKLRMVKEWWLKLNEMGPRFGYFPEPTKCILILKDHSLLQVATQLFADTEMEITCQGQRHLGAVIGSEDFKNEYVSSKVQKWVQDVSDLARIALAEPQAALSAYTKSMCHRWVFLQRTIQNTTHLFSPLEEAIREKLIPAIIGRHVSDIERQILSLPVRFGGLGLANPTETAHREYEASCIITEDLVHLILNQEQDLSLLDTELISEKVNALKSAKNALHTQKFEEIKTNINDENLKRCLDFSREKGSGAWLTALPLKDHGFSLNKQEFRDAVCLRYGWRIPNTPQYCGCGAVNSVNHTLICRKGGFVFMRHNALRDLNAELQSEVCKDVVVEPKLLPVRTEEITGAKGDRACPDISSRGLWSPFERTFYDVRVMHPNCPSYMSTSMAKLYEDHEQEKVKKYNSRVITVEKGTFTPLVYSTFGGWGPQARRYHKRLAEMISKRKNEEYHYVINHIRLKVRFALLRSVLIAIRGERGKRSKPAQPIGATSFNMVPEAMQYESF